jgi:hypothetical protein
MPPRQNNLSIVAFVGQALGLRPPRPPGAGPAVVLRSGDQARHDRIVFDVSLNSPKLLTISNQVIVALVLPKALPCSTQNCVSSFCSCSFQRTDEFGHRDLRCKQQVNVVRHDDPRVQFVVPQIYSKVNRIEHGFSDHRLFKEGRPGAGLIQNSIHRDKRFSRGHAIGGERSVGWQAVEQAKCNEQRLADRVQMRQASARHAGLVRDVLNNSQGGGLGGRRRPRACPTKPQCPHFR